MNTKIISDAEVAAIKISALPTRPTAPGMLGGKGYTARDMKLAFDKLPTFIIERFNSLIEDISALGEGSLASDIPTGISDGHTLSELFTDITDGALAGCLSIGGETLAARMIRLGLREAEVAEMLDALFAHVSDTVADGGSPSGRSKADGEVVA